MRTKLLIAVIPVGFAAAALTGCSKASGSLSSKVEDLTERYALIQSTGLNLAPAQQHYTVDHTSASGLTVPADYSPLAKRMDELNALKVDLVAAQGDPSASPGQKAVLTRMIAEIDAAEAKYLGAMASHSYDPIRQRTTQLQAFADRIDAIQGVITIYEGDRQQVIDTLQTGDAGDLQIAGVDQLQQRADEIQARLDEAQTALEAYQEQAQQYADTAIEHEGRELEFRTEARTATGPEQYDLLDEAVGAKLSARLAEVEAEYNTLMGRVEEQNAAQHTAAHDQVLVVIQKLQTKIAAIRAEIQKHQDEVRDARAELSDAADKLDAAYQDLDDRMTGLVFDRLNSATASGQAAVDGYSGIVTNGQAQGTMRQQAFSTRITLLSLMHQHVVVLSGYKSTLETLAANGGAVLGPNLANTISQRIDELGAEITRVKAEADTVDGAISADETTYQGEAAFTELLTQLDEVRAGLKELPFNNQPATQP